METKKSAPHGQKRPAEDDLKSEQRLSKRFDLLNLEQNGKLYVPVSQPLNTPPPPRDTWDESMQVDDTRNRVYISDLEDELSEIEAGEEKLVFLPDIERKLGKIPESVLLSDVHPSANNQMILYGVPSSLSIPKEQDKVRKAIIESRARARDSQQLDARAAEGVTLPDTAMAKDGTQLDMNHASCHPTNVTPNEDAMDLG